MARTAPGTAKPHRGGLCIDGLLSHHRCDFWPGLLEVIYGQQFGQYYSVAVVLAVACFMGTLALGAIVSLKAVKHTHSLFRINALSLPISVVATVVLVSMFGIIGAAFATLLTTSFVALVNVGSTSGIPEGRPKRCPSLPQCRPNPRLKLSKRLLPKAPFQIHDSVQ